jgi:hypothetical protein
MSEPLSGTAIRVAAAVEAYDQQFLPAWREYQDYLKSRYAPKAAAPGSAQWSAATTSPFSSPGDELAEPHLQRLLSDFCHRSRGHAPILLGATRRRSRCSTVRVSRVADSGAVRLPPKIGARPTRNHRAGRPSTRYGVVMLFPHQYSLVLFLLADLPLSDHG